MHVGDTLAWTFYSENDKTSTIKRQRTGAPRRVGLRIASYMDDWYVHDIEQQGAVTRTPFLAFAEFIAFVSRVCSKIGRALTFARPGQPLDILVSM